MPISFKSFFSQRKARSFDLPYRYYDERKERIEKLQSRRENKFGEFDKEAYRESLREGWRRNSNRSNKKGWSSTLTILLIFALLMLVIYQWLLK